MWATQRKMEALPQTLLHGDPHIGNTYLLPDGGGLLDWQLMMRGCFAHDVAYVIASGLPTATRRREERALLQHDLDAVASHGVTTAPTFDEAFERWVPRHDAADGLDTFVNVVHKQNMLHEPAAAPRPKSRRREVSEERILEAATRMVLLHGYDALNMKDVADAADYTPGALYRYFTSKSALLAAVVTRLLGRLADELGALEQAHGESLALTRVVALGLAYRRFAATQTHAFALFSSMLADPRVLLPEATDRAAILVAMHRTLMPLARQLEQATQGGELPAGSTETRALMIFTALHGALQLGKQERLALLPIQTDPLVRSLLQALLIGLGAHPEAVSQALEEGQRLLTRTPQIVS